MNMLKITVCPTCGSHKIKLVRRDLERMSGGQAYVVPDLEFYECPKCGEKLFDREAMRKIEAHSPAFIRNRRKKNAA
ncbi:MAG: YgiT-type zinc finger protein [Blastocatellia bacterium]